MKKASRTARDADMLDEYDFSGGVRGKYAERYAAGTNVVVLAADVVEYFPDSQSVNQALRSLVAIAQKTAKRGRSRRGNSTKQ